MQDSQRILDNLAYLGYLLSGPQRLITLLDLLLVAMTFSAILILIRHSRAAVLLRGGLLLALLVVAITALLPLPTFDLLLLGALLVGLIATPVIFQPELRRGLERLGRSIGFLRLRPTELVHTVVPVLLRATDNLSRRRTGALIVLEGETSLADIITTGVPLRAELTADLLETIFHDKTPLHDGAVIIREDRVEAAACVLPLSDQVLPAGMHQGTRHRAALGISEQSDCLALIVSEETGHRSVAQNGRLDHDLDSTELRERLHGFYDPMLMAGRIHNGPGQHRSKALTWPRLALPSRATLRRLSTYMITLLPAALLAVAAWLVVADQVYRPQRKSVQGVELKLINQPKDMVLVTQPPTTVEVTVQAPEAIVGTLQPQTFRATADLVGLGPDVHQVPVNVRSGNNEVRVISISPALIDLELQPLASRPISVSVNIPDRESLPFSYEISAAPSVSPAQVMVSGPAEALERLARAEITVALRGTRQSVDEQRLVVLKDATGQALTSLRADPDTVQVTIPIGQRFNTRDAAVHAVITGTVASGYWISNIRVDPQAVTLLGPPAVLNSMRGFVDTVPVDVTGAAGELIRRVPLAPPAGVSALNERGVSEGSVEVRVSVVPQMGNLRLTVPVEVMGVPEGVTASKSPASVDVLLAGPLPVLDQVNADRKLVRVLVDVSELGLGTHDVTPTLIAPEALQATLLPNTIQMRVEQPVPVPTTSP